MKGRVVFIFMPPPPLSCSNRHTAPRRLVRRLQITHNVALSGGAVALSDEAQGRCQDVNFTGNSASDIGGAVHVWGNDSAFIMERCSFLKNIAEDLVDGAPVGTCCFRDFLREGACENTSSVEN